LKILCKIMAETLSSKSGADILRNDHLLMAFVLAIIVHIVALSIKFISPDPKHITKEMDVTLVTVKAPKPPKHAQVLAQEHQVSNGQKTPKPSSPPKQKISNERQFEKEHKAPIRAAEPQKERKVLAKAAESEKTPKLPIKTLESLKPQVALKVIAQKAAEQSSIIAPKADLATPMPPEPKPRPALSAEALQQQIAQLGARIVQHAPSEEPSHIKSLSSVNAHKYVAAQYISDWERKVERTGNLNYPEIARKNNLNGHLTLDVGIKADGSIFSIRVRKSSGYPALDEAAKKIVRMTAPFPPLPKALLNELKVLVITRVWNFSDESGMTAN
jgi:periplasmic protein TonB